jgi:hypothetical protein
MKSLYPESVSFLNSEWVNYTKKDIKTDYDIILDLQRVILSPELIKETEYTETKKIRQGWEYVLDENGNVMKDSLGNDIKKPKYVTISCVVRQTTQRRNVDLYAKIKYINNINKAIIKSIPVKSNFFIENVFAVANGDLRALKPETKKLLNNRPVLMPDDIGMIYQAGKSMREAVISQLKANKSIIK